MPLPKAENTYPQFSILSLARMCWMHRYGIVLSWALLTAGVLAVISRLPKIYAAEALILVDAQKIPERLVPSTVSADIEERLAKISQQILSNTRLNRIIDEYDLYQEEKKAHVQDEIVQMMRRDIFVNVERGWNNSRPNAFRVGYSGKNPGVVAKVTNELANLFIEENLRTREGQAEGTSEFIKNQVTTAKKRLDSLESVITGYKLRHNGELPEQQGALQGAMNRLQFEQISNRDALARAEEGKTTLENSLRLAESTLEVLTQKPGAPLPVTVRRPNIVITDWAAPKEPKKASAELEEKLNELRLHYGEAHPDIKRLKSEIMQAKAVEAGLPPPKPVVRDPKSKSDVEASDVALPAPLVANAADIGQAKEQIETLKARIALAQKDIDRRKAEQERISHEISEYQAKLTSIPLREQEMGEITRDYDMSKGNYRSLLDKQISAEMSTDMERRQKSERFTIIDPAHVPEKPYKPNRRFFAGVGSGFGFVLVLACAIGLEIRKDKLLGEWELPKKLPVLARVPQISMADRGWSNSRWWPSRGKAKRLIVLSSAGALVLMLLAAEFHLNRWF